MNDVLVRAPGAGRRWGSERLGYRAGLVGLLAVVCVTALDAAGAAATNRLSIRESPPLQSGGTFHLRVSVASSEPLDVTYGLESVLERSKGGRWVATYHLVPAFRGGRASFTPIGAPWAVPTIGFEKSAVWTLRLPPRLPAGKYRISKRIGGGVLRTGAFTVS